MKDIFYAEWRDENEQLRGGLYFSWDEYHRDTFSPLAHDHRLIVFETHGRTYKERKEDVRNTAIEWSNMLQIGLHWSDVATIGAWFEKMGRRYGLIEEFRENVVV